MVTKIVTSLSFLLLLTFVVSIPALVPIPPAEALTSAMWTHGNSVQMETPCAATVTRLGFYTRVYGLSAGQTAIRCWFHFAIPTTVYLSDQRLKIEQVLLNFKTSGAYVESVHIYDGSTLLKTYDNLSLHGEHVLKSFSVPTRDEVKSGIGVSVKVGFVPDGKEILFRSAGADFNY